MRSLPLLNNFSTYFIFVRIPFDEWSNLIVQIFLSIQRQPPRRYLEWHFISFDYNIFAENFVLQLLAVDSNFAKNGAWRL